MVIRILTPLDRETYLLLCKIWRPAMRWEVQLVYDNYGETTVI